MKYARARTYFEAQHWEEAALAFRDIALNNADTRRRHLRRAALPRERQRPRRRTPSRRARAASTTWRRTSRSSSSSTATATRSQKNAGAVHDRSPRSSATSSASRRRSSSSCADKRRHATRSQLYEKARQRVLRAVAQVRRGRRSRNDQPPQCEKLRRDRLQRRHAPSRRRASSRRRSAARMILLNPANKLDKTRAREEGDLRDRRQLPGDRRLRPGGQLVRAATRRTTRRRENADKALSDAVAPPPRPRPGGRGDQGRAARSQELRRREARADRRDRVRHRRPLRRARKTGTRREARSQRLDGRHRQGARPTSRCRRTRRSAARFTQHEGRPRQRQGASTRKVRALWDEPGDAAGEDQRRVPGRGRRRRRSAASARRSTPSARRIFFSAEEQAQAEVDPIKFPEYKGTGDKDDVLKHIKTQGRGLVRRRSARDREGRARVHEDPRAASRRRRRGGSSPPARASVSCGATSSTTSARAPIPDGHGRTARRAPRHLLRQPRRGDASRTRSATRSRRSRRASIYSVKYQYFDEFSRNCEVWLAKNYKAEYHVVDELRGAPTLVEQRSRRQAAAAHHRRDALAPAAAAPGHGRRTTKARTTDRGRQGRERGRRRSRQAEEAGSSSAAGAKKK